MPPRSMSSVAAAANAQSQPQSTAQSKPAQDSAAKPRVYHVDVDTEVPIQNVRLDGLAVLKVVKHAREAHANLGAFSISPPSQNQRNAQSQTFVPATGRILGIDLNGTLDVSDCFALPNGVLTGSSQSGEGTDARPQRVAADITEPMLSRLEDINVDSNVVGFYFATPYGTETALPGFLDALVAYQLGLTPRTAAKSVLSSASRVAPGKGVALVLDPTTLAQGSVTLRAFRLSQNFLDTYRTGKFDATTLGLAKLVSTNMLREYPVTVRSSTLLTAFLSTVISEDPSSSTSDRRTTLLSGSGPPQSFSPLSSPTSNLYEQVAALTSMVDNYLPVSHFRAVGKDRGKLEDLVNKRKNENSQRARDGLPPLPPSPEELALLHPGRRDNMTALRGLLGASQSLGEATRAEIVRTFGAASGQGVVAEEDLRPATAA